jgi:hypothetical protein
MTPRSPRPLSRSSRVCALAYVILLGTLSSGVAHASLVSTSAVRRSVLMGALTPVKLTVSANVEECLTSETQDERSATFAGEMTAVAGTAKMEMRIDVLERTPGEPGYHTLTAPGLGVWRNSAPGVKVYKYLKQVTNLSAPAFYRAAVRFRWLGPKGRLLASTELHTRRCEEPAPEAPTTTTEPGNGSSNVPGSAGQAALQPTT